MADIVEPLLASCFEVSVGAFADLKTPETLIRDVECFGQVSDCDVQILALLAELLPDHSRWSGVSEEGEDFVCNVTFEAADNVAIRESFGSAPLKILHRARVVVAVSDKHNAMDGMVCTAVTTAGEAVTHTLTRRRRDRRNTTQGSELSFAVDPFRVIADGCEQRRSDDRSYSVGIEQRRVQLSDERVELQI